MHTIVDKIEFTKRLLENKAIFPANNPRIENNICENCFGEKQKGDVFEDNDLAVICNYCYWTRNNALDPSIVEKIEAKHEDK